MNMRIALIDPFFEVSHSHWANGIVDHSRFAVDIFCNKAKHWKWQMIGGTLELASRVKSQLRNYDLIIVTDMIDLPSFLGYLTKEKTPPVLLYFHENQITYPWSETDQDIKSNRDHHYGFMNLRSAYVADYIAFNSEYHFNSFYGAIPKFIGQFPSIKWPFTIDNLKEKSTVIPIGINKKITTKKPSNATPYFVWNHRWEYDKGPDKFFNTLFWLDYQKIDFKLIVLGKPYVNQPKIFDEAKERLSHNILHWGYAENKDEYYEKLNMANIALITGNQDFFGISVVESIQYGCLPLLPNRLAYPEHLPAGLNDVALYSEDDMMQNLMQVIRNKSFLNTSSYQEFITKYHWGNVIEFYDQVFEEIVHFNSAMT
tara:strand:+ start:92 stop:1204 length:1113 start_codon:yes stop_codon:yes gene_type:complete